MNYLIVVWLLVLSLWSFIDGQTIGELIETDRKVNEALLIQEEYNAQVEEQFKMFDGSEYEVAK